MQVIKDRIGNVDILVETLDNVELLPDYLSDNSETMERQTRPTGISSNVSRAYEQAKSTITSIAQDIGAAVTEMDRDGRPRTVEMEFNLGFSAEAEAWVISGRSDCALKIKFTWNLEPPLPG